MSINNNQNEQHWMLLVLLLKHIAKEKGITQEVISDVTGYNQSNISRIFALRYCPSLEVFLSIASAIGVNLFIEDKESKTELNKVFEKAMEELGRRPDKLSKN